MPKIVDHDQQREWLLDACFRVFARDGFANATMRKLAKEAGVSTGTLYHYFPDKSSLLSGLFAMQIARDRSRVTNTLPEEASVPVRIKVLFAFFREHRDYLTDLLRLALEVHRHEPFEGSREQVQSNIAEYQDALADILGIEPLIAKMAFQVLIGSLVHGLLDPDAIDLDAQEAFLQTVWANLAPA